MNEATCVTDEGRGILVAKGSTDEEREADLTDAGFAVERIVGLEGPASNMQRELAEASEDARDSVGKLARALREDRTIADVSEHILAVGRA